MEHPPVIPASAGMGTPVHAGGLDGLVQLDADHPGFHDPRYRQRRDHIAELALRYQPGDPVPHVDYTGEEHEVWRTVWAHLDPLHARGACAAYHEAAALAPLPRDRIPQLAEVNDLLRPHQGFSMLPVAGLVSERMFLSYLARGVFLSTQYMRHHSAPLYTPEPDVIHEVVGHAATLGHPAFASLNRAFGAAALRLQQDEQVHEIARVYWYTLEFGAVHEDGAVKAYGAGLLSSCGELTRFLDEGVHWPFDLARMAATPYDPTTYQPGFFVAPSFAEMVRTIIAWLETR